MDLGGHWMKCMYMDHLNCLNELRIVFRRVLSGVGMNLRPLVRHRFEWWF